jgi:tRNA pseudouridine13 synthase
MQLKTIPEDFIVVEIANRKSAESGSYALVELTKRNISTERAMSIVADSLQIHRRFLGYAGAKDARALTKQYISVKIENSAVIERIKNFKRDNIVLRLLGFLHEPIGLGNLEKNRFEIVCRKITDEQISELRQIPNYFDEQRFSRANAEIGKLILQGELKRAVERIIETDTLMDERLRSALEKNPNDAVSALRLMPKNILLMYVHAYQSLLFNEVLTEHIKKSDPHAVFVDGPVKLMVPSKDLPDVDIPIFGFGTERDPMFGTLYETILEREGLEARDFVVRSLPFLTVEGGERSAFFKTENLEIGKQETDEIFENCKKQRLSFTLPKACYATMVVKCLYRVGRVLGNDETV